MAGYGCYVYCSDVPGLSEGVLVPMKYNVTPSSLYQYYAVIADIEAGRNATVNDLKELEQTREYWHDRLLYEAGVEREDKDFQKWLNDGIK